LVSGSATSRELIEEMKTVGVEPVDYSGPSSIHSLIMDECKRKNLPAFSMWGHAPEYIDEVDPRTAHCLLTKTISLMGIEADLEELQMEGNLFKKRLDSLMEQDNSFSQLVHSLEIDYKNAKRSLGYFT
jgi:proteasome assembly chaperone (PAC2) family protein